jgi:hypothetical protein
MKIKIYALLVVSLILTCINSKAQNKLFVNPNPFTHKLNNGIPISKTDFDKKISKYLKMMMEGSKFNAKDYMDMARVYNTIGWSFDTPSGNYRLFYDAFLVMYTRPAVKELSASVSKGMSY